MPEPSAHVVHGRLLTPATAAGAVAAIRLSAGEPADLDSMLEACCPTRRRHLSVGEVRLADLAGVDRGLIARWSDTVVDLFPHGGAYVVRALLDALEARGVVLSGDATQTPWDARQPAARDELEAQMLDVLARAASPRATDVLLRTLDAWRSHAPVGSDAWRHAAPTKCDTILARLIDPPLVVLLGAPNIGKSTLLNALARRAVSMVDATPGSTRDHVGVLLELDGIVVRCVDTPGIRTTSDAIEREAQQIARSLATRADLIVLCGDQAHPPVPDHELPDSAGVSCVCVALRADLGAAAWPHECRVSAAQGQGIDVLARHIRQALVPDEVLADATAASPQPWRFWAS
ncbi:MAG: GTPase [Planctomycetota bacterium]|nr:GTPase [Planctomycetota bacterium]